MYENSPEVKSYVGAKIGLPSISTNGQIDTIMDLTNLIEGKLQTVLCQPLPSKSEKTMPRTELEERLGLIISRLEDLSDRICL